MPPEQECAPLQVPTSQSYFVRLRHKQSILCSQSAIGNVQAWLQLLFFLFSVPGLIRWSLYRLRAQLEWRTSSTWDCTSARTRTASSVSARSFFRFSILSTSIATLWTFEACALASLLPVPFLLLQRALCNTESFKRILQSYRCL